MASKKSINMPFTGRIEAKAIALNNRKTDPDRPQYFFCPKLGYLKVFGPHRYTEITINRKRFLPCQPPQRKKSRHRKA
jgi:hypothetical protein